jgi:3-dehydroquinate synthase
MHYQTINVTLPNQHYPIYIGSDLLSKDDYLKPHIHGNQVMIVTQKLIANLYLEKLLQALKNYHCDVVIIPTGERHKTLKSFNKIIDNLLAKGHERSTTLIALGGGMVGDVTGFAAACYQRSVNYIQIPTTLIAQVDAAIGGKTGVNHSAGKNLIGAFHHPQCVIADIALLASLPQREFVAGLAEVIKCSLIKDKNFFSWLEDKQRELIAKESNALLEMITRTISIKAQIVSQDDREQKNIRHLLNFGHTAGHALEALSQYQLLHGEAVAIGIRIACMLSVDRGWLTEQDYQRIYDLLSAYQLSLPLIKGFKLKKFLDFLSHDKKNFNQRLRFVLLKEIGQAELTDTVTEADLIKIISRLEDGR